MDVMWSIRAFQNRDVVLFSPRELIACIDTELRKNDIDLHKLQALF